MAYSTTFAGAAPVNVRECALYAGGRWTFTAPAAPANVNGAQ
jgi:hypothetical protein